MMPSLSILLKPASSACNLRCDYCFYADEANIRATADYGMMSRAVSHALIEKAAGAAQGSVSFLFQGGEPTLAGLDFYRDFAAYAKETFPSGLAVQYAIQTNGI
ncbi:MAG: 4Fe-4S cluster-binding domain-containing protein, partial [Lachnospiraceae bacterium]|nr:4Fe-4S cluster-binding domain-containing protein [Lachnospiraceae bacterium]